MFAEYFKKLNEKVLFLMVNNINTNKKKQRVGRWNSVNYVVRINSKWNVVFLLKFQHGHTKYLLNNIFTQAIFFPLAFYLCACVRPTYVLFLMVTYVISQTKKSTRNYDKWVNKHIFCWYIFRQFITRFWFLDFLFRFFYYRWKFWSPLQKKLSMCMWTESNIKLLVDCK